MSGCRQFCSKTTTFGKSTKTHQHLQLLSASRIMLQLTLSRIHTSPNFSPSSPLKKFPELLKVGESMGTSRCHINSYEKVLYMTTTSPPFLTLCTAQIYVSLLAFLSLGYQRNGYSCNNSRGKTSPLLPLIFYDFLNSDGFGVKVTTAGH